MAEGKKLGKYSRNKRKSKPKMRAKQRDSEGLDMIYGVHAVLQALANPARRFDRLLVSENALRRHRDELAAAKCPQTTVRPDEISRHTGKDAVHQGVLLFVHPLPEQPLDKILESQGPVVLLDQVTDPHNVGAILRSCAAFNAAGLVITARHSPQASGVLAKAASGALEHVPVIRVTNLANALSFLSKHDIACIGLDSEAEQTLEHVVASPHRTAIVLGAEGKGLRQKTRRMCDFLARLDMTGPITSLNVSNAAVLALYVACRKAS